MATILREMGKIRNCGVFTIPASLRKRFDLEDGSLLIAEEHEDGIFLRAAEIFPSITTDETLSEARYNSMLKYAGVISMEDLDLMEAAIEEGCERIYSDVRD